MILGLRRIYIRLWLVNHDLNDDQSKVLYPHSCHEWLITIKFEAEDGGYIQATSRCVVSMCVPVCSCVHGQRGGYGHWSGR